MFRKVENLGKNGNFLDLIKDIYCKTKSAVKIGNNTTNFFPYSKGVQQGNPLSLLLFNICINDIFQKIKNESLVTLDNEYFFNAMNYADDLIIFSTTEDGLQSSLDSLGSYCEEWKLEVNNKKSNDMIFKKGTQKETREFKIKNNTLKIVKEYKYLGSIINYKNCSFTPTVTDLSSKGLRALHAICSKLQFKLASIQLLLKIFDTYNANYSV